MQISFKNTLGVWITLGGFLCTNPGALANDGVLPKGKKKGPGSKLVLPKSNRDRKSCHQFLASPLTPNGFFPDRDSFYYLAKEPKGKSGRESYYLVTVDFPKGIAKKIISLKLRRDGILIPHGKPIKAISIFSAFDGDPNCLAGRGRLISLLFTGRQRVKKNARQEYLRILESDRGREVADLASSTLRLYDPNTLQNRMLGSFPSGKTPLYFNNQKQLVYILDEANPPVVSRVKTTNGKIEASFKGIQDFKILRQRDLFGFFGRNQADPAGVIQVGEIQGWSGPRSVKYQITLPSGYSYGEAGAVVDFRSKFIVVQGNTRFVRKRWRRVFIYAYDQGKLLKTFTAPTGNYIGDVSLSPHSSLLVFTIKSVTKDDFVGMSTFDTVTKVWQRIHFKF